MITTKGKPVIREKCFSCAEIISSYPSYRRKKPFSGDCSDCNNTGYIYTEIPVEYQEEVKRLLKIRKPDPKDPEETMTEFIYMSDEHTEAQTRLQEIEQSIIKNSKG